MPKEVIRSLLVHEREDRFLILKSALQGLGIQTTRARTCRAAGALLCDTPPPLLAFTDVVLPDGNWMDMLDLTAKTKDRVNLIVVSPRADIELYIDVMNHGAYDFITESFTVPEIVHVVRSGIESARQSRETPPEAKRKPRARAASKDDAAKPQSVGAARV
jgi:DNA-binding NtrC family response regulator